MSASIQLPLTSFSVSSEQSLKMVTVWLILANRIPVACEEGALGKSTSRGRLAHTNLSGGKVAHCGGELWFRDASSIRLTGGSGRYPPRSEAELDEIAASFRTAGFLVANCGWDIERDGPARFFRPGREQWS